MPQGPLRGKAAAFLKGVLANFRAPPAPVHIADCHERPVTRPEMTSNLLAATPVVLRGLLGHYPVGRWSVGHLRGLDLRRPASPVVQVARTTVEQGQSRIQAMPFRDFATYLEEHGNARDEDIPFGPADVPALIDPAHYLYCNEDQSLVREHFPELLLDLQPLREVFPQWVIQEYSLWIGPKGSVTGLHCDHDYNCLAQCAGHKTMLLIPAEQEPLLYRSRKYDPGASLSQVDLRRPKHNAMHFPSLRDATPYVAHLQPGDLICIPRRWYHFVFCTAGPSVSCTLHNNTPAMKAVEQVGKAGHWLRLYGWTDAGCTCHGAP